MAMSSGVRIAGIEGVCERADELQVSGFEALAGIAYRKGCLVVNLCQFPDLDNRRRLRFDFAQLTCACSIAQMEDDRGDWIDDGGRGALPDRDAAVRLLPCVYVKGEEADVQP